MRGRAAAFAVAIALVVLVPVVALAQEQPAPAPSADRIKAAAEEFDRGRRSYLAKDFVEAAGHFENAFRDAPSKETLRLAIRARRDAKQPARAATLAAVAQAMYASDAPTAQIAKETLAEATPSLSEYVIDCASACTIAADGRVVSQADGAHHRVFLDPGAHDLAVSFGNQPGSNVSKHVEGKKGTSTPLTFDAPPPPTPTTPPTATTTPTPPPTATPPPPPPPPPPQKPLGPVVFFIAAGVTVAAGAGTIVSGLATQNDPGVDAVRRDCAGKDESCPTYQRGQDAELRTNILLGVTIGAAAITGVIGLFFTQWSSPSSAKTAQAKTLRLSPFGLSGRF